MNVGALFLSYEREYLSFHYEYWAREAGYVEYLDEDRFRVDGDNLAAPANQRVVALRDELKSFQRVTRPLEAGPLTGWSNYHCGVASALAAETGSARRYFQSVIDDEDNRDWARSA